MKLFNLFLLILLFTTTTAISQNKTDKVTLTITPSTLLDPQPHLRVGTDFCINNYMVASCDFGYGCFKMSNIHENKMEWSKDYKFYEVRPELKFYIFKKLYLGTELFYLKLSDVITNSYFSPSDAAHSIAFSRADYIKTKSGFHIKTGVRVMAASRFNMEFYFGLGKAFRTVAYKNVQKPSYFYNSNEFEDDLFVSHIHYPGSESQMNTTFGIKLGYVIVKQTPR